MITASSSASDTLLYVSDLLSFGIEWRLRVSEFLESHFQLWESRSFVVMQAPFLILAGNRAEIQFCRKIFLKHLTHLENIKTLFTIF